MPLTLIVEKTVRLCLWSGFKCYSLYFLLLKFYRVFLAKALLGDLISFSVRLKRLLFYFFLILIIIFMKYLFLVLLIIFAITFVFFFVTIRLRLNFLIYIQQLCNFLIIVVGGVVVYS